MPAPEPLLPSTPVTPHGERRRARGIAFGVIGGVLAIGAVLTTLAVTSAEPDPSPAPVSATGPGTNLGSVPTPEVTTTESAGPAFLVSIPEGFPLAAGYPDENEDRSPVKVTDKPGFKQVELCGTTVWSATQPSTPADLAGTSTTNPEDLRARTLALYPDDAAATAALSAIVTGYDACSYERTGGTRQNYQVLSSDDATLVVAHTYGPPSDHSLGAEIDQYVRVGNALFLDSLYGESGTSEEALASFAHGAAEAAAPVVDALVALTSDDDATSPPSEAGTVPLDPQDLLMIKDLPAPPDYAAPWEGATADTLTWACHPQGFSDLGADGSVAIRYQALTDNGSSPTVPTVRARDAVLQFKNPDAARAAYDKAVGYLKSCEADQGLSAHGKAIENSTDAGPSYLQGFVYAAPETCTDCDAAWFDYQGVTQNGDRLVLVSYAQVGGPLAPENIRNHAQGVTASAASRSGR